MLYTVILLQADKATHIGADYRFGCVTKVCD